MDNERMMKSGMLWAYSWKVFKFCKSEQRIFHFNIKPLLLASQTRKMAQELVKVMLLVSASAERLLVLIHFASSKLRAKTLQAERSWKPSYCIKCRPYSQIGSLESERNDSWIQKSVVCWDSSSKRNNYQKQTYRLWKAIVVYCYV